MASRERSVAAAESGALVSQREQLLLNGGPAEGADAGCGLASVPSAGYLRGNELKRCRLCLAALTFLKSDFLLFFFQLKFYCITCT